jgi:hypothetical protein
MTAVSAASSAAPGGIQVVVDELVGGIPPERVAYLHPDDTTPMWQLFFKKVGQVLLMVLIPLAIVFGFYMLLPTTFSAILLPFIGLASVGSCAFLFSSPKVELEAYAYDRVFPPRPPLPPLTAEAPRGIRNEGATCWVDSLSQILTKDRGIMDWIRNSPRSDGFRHAAFMPQDLLFTDQERAAHPIEYVPLAPMLPSLALPPRFASFTPQQKAQHRRNGEIWVLDWVAKCPEIEILTDQMILGNEPPEQFINHEVLARFPAPERLRRRENALFMIRQLRVFAALQRLDETEKNSLANKIRDYRFGLEALRYLIQFAEVIPVFDLVLGGVGLNIEMQNRVHADQVDLIQTQLELLTMVMTTNPHLRQFIMTARTVSVMTRAERDNLLDYLAVIQSIDAEKRAGAVHFLARYKAFYENYEHVRRQGGNATAAGSSSDLRRAFSQISSAIRADGGREEDPAEAVSFLIDLLPARLKVNLQVSRTYENAPGLPRVETQPNLGNIELDIIGANRGIQEMLHHFENREAESDEGLIGEDQQFNRMLNTQTQFDRGPASLWITVKRFRSERSWDLFHCLLPSCFPEPAQRQVKVETPIHLDEIIELNTRNEGVVRYKLDGFIVHSGRSIHAGHYIAYMPIVNAEGQEEWYEMDDSRVRKVEGEE